MESLKKFLIGFFVASALILVSCPQPNSDTGGGGSTTEETGGSGSGSGGETGGGQTGEQGSGETGGGEVTKSTADFAAASKNENISAKTDINVGSAWVVGDVTVTTVKTVVAKQSYGYQLQKNSSATIKSTSGKKITGIEIACITWGTGSDSQRYCVDASADNGSFKADKSTMTVTWVPASGTTSVDSVTITADQGQLRISGITLYCQ